MTQVALYVSSWGVVTFESLFPSWQTAAVVFEWMMASDFFQKLIISRIWPYGW